jgi:hypothetical protein
MGEEPVPDSKFSTWRLWCDTPVSPRWQSTQTPRIGRLCLVSGNFIGNYKWENVLLPCMTLTNLSYLPSDSQAANASQVPAVTPSGRKRGRNVFGSEPNRAPASMGQPLPPSVPTSSQVSASDTPTGQSIQNVP